MPTKEVPPVREYTVQILSTDPAHTSATITVRLDPHGPEIHEITVHIGSDATPFPEELAQLDFHSAISAAATLSRGHLPTGPDTTAPDTDPIESQPVDQHQQRATSAPGTPRPSTTPAAQSRRGGRQRHTTGKTDLPSDLAMTYWKLGTTAKVAAHYSVPRQVAHKWIQLLRQGGTLPNPWKQKGIRSGTKKDEGH